MLVEAAGDGREVGREESVEEVAGFEAPMDWLTRVAERLDFAAGTRRLPTARGTNAGAVIGFDEVEGGGPSSGVGEPVVAADGVAGPENSESGVSIANEAGERYGGRRRRSSGQEGEVTFAASQRIETTGRQREKTAAIYSCESDTEGAEKRI